MSIDVPKADKRYIIKQAINSKGLATLSRIEDKANPPKKDKVTKYRYQHLAYDYDKANKLVKGKSPEEILELAGIGVYQLKDGSKSITDYYQPSHKFTYTDLGIDESELIEGVSLVHKSLNLVNTNLENTGTINTVYEDLVIGGKTNLKDISSLKRIYGSVIVYANSKEEAIAQLKKLKFKPNVVAGKLIIIPDSVNKL